MSLANRCRSHFPSDVLNRGELYFVQGRVKLHLIDDEGICAEVRGTARMPYDVALHWDRHSLGKIAVVCDCPAFRGGGPCKHIWATILAADVSGQGATVPGAGALDVVLATVEDATAAAGRQPARPDPGSRARTPVAAQRQVAPPKLVNNPPAASRGENREMSPPRKADPDWQRQLKMINHAMQNYDTLSQPPVPQGIASHPEGSLRFLIHREASARAGELRFVMVWAFVDPVARKIAFAGLDARSIPAIPDDECQMLAKLLYGDDGRYLGEDFEGEYDDYSHHDWSDDDEDEDEQNGYYQDDSRRASPRRNSELASLDPECGRLSDSLVDLIMPRLCANARCQMMSRRRESVGEALEWDAAGPWDARVRLEADGDSAGYRLTGALQRGDERISLADVELLLPSGVYVTLRRCGRVRVDQQLRWLVEMRGLSDIKVAEADAAKFLERLWDTPFAPQLELPADLDWENVEVDPVPQVHIKPDSFPGALQAWSLTPQFLYGDQIVGPLMSNAVVVSGSEHRVYRRKFEEERRRWQELTSVPQVRTRMVYTVKGSGEQAYVDDKRLDKVLDRLVQAGWQVVLVDEPLRKGGALRLSVKSTVDWFELEGELDYDGASVKLPALLAALRDGKSLIRLDDGTCAIIPQAVRDRFARLASLANTDDKGVRFRPSQALLLDALLAAEGSDRVRLDQRFEEARARLRAFSGVKALAPPDGFRGELRGYQQEGLGWLEFLRDFGFGGCLADDMGLGKTIQILAMLEMRRNRPTSTNAARTPSLIVVPKSLVFNWIEEAARFTPALRFLNYTGIERRERKEQIDSVDVVVTTYGTLRQDIQELKERVFDYVILDEAQAIKNSASQAAKACRLLKGDHRLALTGTPVENHLGELWSLFEFLNPGLLGQSGKFQSLVKATSKGPVVSPAGLSAAEPARGDASRVEEGSDDSQGVRRMLSQALRPFILRRTKQQVLTELPERTEQTLFCEMEKKQKDLYDELRDYYRRTLTSRVARGGMAKAKIHVLEALLRLRQVACHPALLDKNKADLPSAKLDALLEQLEELVAEGHKALVFSQFTSLLAIVRDELDRRSIRYEYLDGQTTDRQRRVTRFQSDDSIPLFLISLRAGGQGLNLTAADYVFILDPWWNPAVESQAIDRAYRMGQTRHVFAYRLICRGTVEEKILELQRSKRELADAIITEDNSVLRNLTTEDLELLLS